MTSNARTHAELQSQRTKLTSSYNALLEEFSSKDLRTVGNYTLGDLIGKGSFGKVYLARHRLTSGSKVVLKQANKNDSNLAREIHHHRQFLHPHIARLYEVIVTETHVWLVLEYCPGDELYHYLTKHGPIEPPKVQKIFTQLVGAVSYVHSKSCVHRDLKLENILLDKNGNVKLCDFGFTREYEGKASYLQTWCGTVCYSAPEMLRGEKYAGEKVDVWSLGIILYALLCGELPYDEDDETATKVKILKEEPKYPDHIPSQAKDLLVLLLSKRPLLRPSLSDILTNSWLAERAPQQQAILKLQQPAPFSTQLEKDALQKMRSAGVDIDAVIENVLSQRCDTLAGWWALLMEKEERRDRRRQRKRKEKEAEAKALRRLSGTSSHRLDSVGPTIRESDEEGSSGLSAKRPSSRDRDGRRPNSSVVSSSLPTLVETDVTRASPPSKVEVPVVVSSPTKSPSTPGPEPPPKDIVKINNVLYHSNTSPELGISGIQKRRRYQPPFITQLTSIKHWFKDSTKRGRGPVPLKDATQVPTLARQRNEPHLRRISAENNVKRLSSHGLRPDLSTRSTFPKPRPRVLTHTSTSSSRRASHSPSPLTPQSSYRRHSSNLRGRKSTSSSVSSVLSFPTPQQHPTHSKASSTSSQGTSAASPSISLRSPSIARSPSAHSSIKVLPAAAATAAHLVGAGSDTTFPSHMRIARGIPPSMNLSESQAAFQGLGPPSPGLVFAKRKRTPFKGPLLGSALGRRRSPGDSLSNSRTGSLSGARSSIVIEEEEEEGEGLDGEEDIEEVDTFGPVLGPGEYVEEPLAELEATPVGG